jgi:threonine synthase
MPSSLACSGCGWAPPDNDPFPFRCANAGSGDDVDHVIVRTLDPSNLSWPTGQEANPFVRYRTLFRSHHVATSRNMTDAEYVELVERLDKEVAAVDGKGFAITPFERKDELSTRLGFSSDGGVWVKDETGNVSGSHKARHLMGLAIWLEVVDRLGLTDTRNRRLAIASCGNAALAAAVVARAADRPLDVFVPTWADEAILRRLKDLGATITTCPREEGVPGDPTYHALQRAIAGGAIPFTCQGPDNGLTIEGGMTLGYELAAAGQPLDRVFVQVGGGALASSTIQGLDDARLMGTLEASPKLHAVQTEGGYPLGRSYEAVVQKTFDQIAWYSGWRPDRDEPAYVAQMVISQSFGSPAIEDALAHARTHRSQFMWPWEEEPKSIAHGILDDETYDWYAVVRGMIQTAGFPVVVDEDTLREANEVGRSTIGIAVDHTGTAGLAGLMKALKQGHVRPDERVAVLFTGAIRGEGERA